MNDSAGSTDRLFDRRDRFTMTVLRGTLRDPKKDDDEAAALVDVLRPLLRESADLNEAARSGREQQDGTRGWSVIDDASLSAAQRAHEVLEWTPEMVGARVRSLGAAFAPYAAVMVENGVDGEMLAALDETDFVEDLGVKRMHAKKLLKLVAGLDMTAGAWARHDGEVEQQAAAAAEEEEEEGEERAAAEAAEAQRAAAELEEKRGVAERRVAEGKAQAEEKRLKVKAAGKKAKEAEARAAEASAARRRAEAAMATAAAAATAERDPAGPAGGEATWK
jgi:hypothetical protein